MRLLNHINAGKVIRFIHQVDEKIMVIEDEHYLWLTFDNIIQSGMLKRSPTKLIMPHQQALFIPLLFTKPNNIVELGLGGGNFTRTLKQYAPNSSLITAEINTNVIALFHQFFNPEEIECDIRPISGEQILIEETEFDWLVCDIFSPHNHQFLSQITQVIEQQKNVRFWTINLPNAKTKLINQLLEELKRINQKKRQQQQQGFEISYIEIPHFKNVMIYLIPLDTTRLAVSDSYLPLFLYQKLFNAWQQRKVIN